jgi:AsmA protein
MKRWKKIAIAIAVLVVVVVLSLFFLVNANTFRPMLESQLTTALGRQTTLGNLKFSPFSGSLVADNLSIADDPDYSKTPFVTAKQLRIGVDMRLLIFSRQLRVRRFEAESPQIHLVKGANGNWNFSSIGKNAPSRTGNAQKESAFPDLTVDLIAIRNGRGTVESLSPDGPARVYDNVNLSMRQFSFARQFPFTLSADLPGKGRVAVDGQAGPINAQNAAMTAARARISVKHLDPVAAGFLDPKAGISTLVDIDANAASDGLTLNSNGTVHMERLKLTKDAMPAPRPVDLVYNVTQNLKDDTGNLNSAEIKIGHVAIQLNGAYRLVPEDPPLDLTVGGQGLPIDELQTLLNSAGIQLPNGSMLKGGTLTFVLAVSGPADNLVITGPVSLNNTQLAGFDLGSKISGVAALGRVKTGDATDIQALRFNLRATNAGIQTDNLYASMPALGVAKGSGTVSPAKALDYRLVVQVSTARGIGKVGAGLLTKLNSLGDSTAGPAAANGVPVRIIGTANDPVITADVKGLMQRNTSALFGKAKKNNPGAVLKGLFGKKH